MREGENAEVGGLEHIPLILIHNRLAEYGEHASCIDAVLVHRKRIEAVDDDAEVLLELFEHGDVHLRLVVAQAQNIALPRGSADNLNREQYNRRVTRLDAALGFVPTQQTHGNIERIGAVLLDGRLGAAVKALDARFQLGFGENGAQAMVCKFRLDQLGKAARIMHILEACVLGTAPFGGFWQDGEVLAVGERVLQIVERGGEDRNNGFGKTQVYQVIAQSQIKQLAFPLHLLGELRFVLPGQVGDKFIDFPRPHRGSQVVFFVLLDNKARVGADALRQRTDAAVARAVHVNDAFDTILVELLFRVGTRLIKGTALAADHHGAFGDGDLIDSEGKALAYDRCVVLHRLREGQILQPNAAENMTARQQQKRVQAYRLHT